MSDRPVVRGKALQQAIIQRARQLGWRVAHFPPISTTRGGRTYWLTPVAADGKGFPDLLMVRDRPVVMEVKGDGDYLKPDQEQWLIAWRLAGVEAHVVTPVMWRDGDVDAILMRRGAETPSADLTHRVVA
jgi:hypothetical protein